MAISIVSTGLSTGRDLESLKPQPEFRKATRNMMLAWLSIEEALAPFGGQVPGADPSAAALVLGSGFGEIEVTKDFLKGLAESGMARPILFQNSLHNATLGFLATKLKFTGPTITVSNRCLTGENCLEVATLLLEQGQCRFCLATGVDTLVPAFNEILGSSHSDTPVVLGEGAATVLLTSEAGLRELRRPALATLDDLTYGLSTHARGSSTFDGYYEADALEKLVMALRTHEIPGSRTGAAPLALEKPDGTSSMIHWSRPAT